MRLTQKSAALSWPCHGTTRGQRVTFTARKRAKKKGVAFLVYMLGKFSWLTGTPQPQPLFEPNPNWALRQPGALARRKKQGMSLCHFILPYCLRDLT